MKSRQETKEQLANQLAETQARLQTQEIEHRHAEETLRQRTADLQMSQEKLEAFSQALTKDIRVPLGLIVSYAQVLEQDYATLPSEELGHYLHTIAQRGYEMVGVVDELLAARAEPAKEIAEEIGPLDMSSVVEDALERLGYMVDEYQAEVVIPERWPLALGHAPWVEEVWANLISNALKYGGRPPRVELGATTQEDGTVRFWVRDNGPGLAPEEQVRLFTRPDDDPATAYGLGLVLVQRVVAKIGGEVGVESEVGKGSLFYFTLPAAG